MPAASASLVVRGATSRPSRRTVPASRDSTPVITLISVALPAPFSPSSAWISPERNVKSTASSARSAAKLLLSLRTSNRGGRDSLAWFMEHDFRRRAAVSGDARGHHSLIGVRFEDY